MKKRLISLLLCVVMLLGMLPVGEATAAGEDSACMKIFHLDCGRKYFSVSEIKALIDTLAENDYNFMELAFGNNGLRFLLDEMSVSANESSYESDSVKAAIIAGNEAYTTASTGELSQSQMTEIIKYAADKGIEIIPLLNSPGHMNAMLSAMERLSGENYAYGSSDTTIDVTNTKAVAFAQAIIKKYVEYFDAQGCKYFNIGADEYANDVYTSGAMGFGELIDEGNYSKYVDYINGLASIIKEAGMTPMAFNDGIYFNDTKLEKGSQLEIDTDILVCYWTSGWGGYSPRSAANLVSDGFSIINTNDAWYYVLGRASGTYGLGSAQSGTAGTHYSTVTGDTAGTVSPVGSMVCLWCDTPGVSYNSNEQENVTGLISTFAENNPEVFTLNSGEDEENTDSDPEDTTTLPDEYTGSVSGTAGGAGVVYILDTDGVNAGSEYLIVAPKARQALGYFPYERNGKLCYGADEIMVTITAEKGVETASGSNLVLWKFSGAGEAKISSGEVYIQNNSNGIIGSSEDVWSITNKGDGKYSINNGQRYLGYENGFTRSKIESYVRLFKKTEQSGYTVGLEGIKELLADTESLYNGGNNSGGYGTELWSDFATAYVSAGNAISNTEGSYSSEEEANTPQEAVNYAARQLYTAWQALKAESVVLTVDYICGSSKIGSDEYCYADGATAVVTAKDITGYTVIGSGTRTVTMNGDTSIEFYYEANAEDAEDIYAEYLCTSMIVTGSDGKTGKAITAQELSTPQYVVNLAPATANNGTYYFWKARVIDRSQTDGGQMNDSMEDNECITETGAWDIDALMYQDGSYWFRVAGSDSWTRLNYTENGSSEGHQLVFYYECRYSYAEGYGAAYSSDWGLPSASDRSVYEVRMTIYELNGENETLISSESTWLANGIRVLRAELEPNYELVKTVVKYYDGVQTIKSSSELTSTAEYDGQIPDSPSLSADKNGATEVIYYIREKAELHLSYEWLNHPNSVSLPTDSTAYKSGDTVTVNASFAEGSTVTEGQYLYTFSGWHTDKAMTQNAEASFVISGDTVLYGNWSRKLNDAITVTANSAEKVYDGEALSDNGYSVSYLGKTIEAEEDGTYIIADEKVRVTAEVSGTITDVGNVTNKVSSCSVSNGASETTEYRVLTVDGTLTVRPRIIIKYYSEAAGTDNYLGEKTMEQLCAVGDKITLGSARLDAMKPRGYESGEQQGDVPYTVTTENEQIINVLYRASPISVSVTKVWNDRNDEAKKRPESVTVQLTADDGALEGTGVTLNAANSWTYTWEGLPVYNEEKEIVYSVIETVVPADYSAELSGSVEEGFTITNSYPAKYTVSYKYTEPKPAQAPALPVDVKYASGERVAVAAAPSLEGYTFSGWSRTGSFDMPEEDVTITGSWTLNKYGYTVNYYKDSADASNIIVSESGEADFGSEIPYTNGKNVPKGYNSIGAVSGASTVTSTANSNVVNIVYSALPTYSVKYEWSGKVPAGLSVPVDNGKYYIGQTYTLDGKYTTEYKLETKDEYGNVNGRYTFSGWNDPKSGTMGNADVTVTGVWEYESVTVTAYKVTYSYTDTVPAGAPQLPAEKTYVPDEPVAVAAAPSLEGYTFSGWSRTGSFDMPAEDVTIIGSWTLNKYGYTVEYYFDGSIDSELTVSERADYGTTVSGYTDKVKCGYKLDKTVGLPLTVSAAEANNVIKVYYVTDEAQTKELSYTVEYYKNGEKVEADTQTVTATVQVLEPDTMAVDKSAINTTNKYEGYKLDEADTGTIPDSAATGAVIKIYYITDEARTKELSYTVEYYKDGAKVDSDTQIVKKTVQVLQPNALDVAESDINTADKYPGYKFQKTDPAEIPASVESDTVIKVYYVTDEAQTKELSYTVEYYKDGAKVDSDTQTVTATVQVLEPNTLPVNKAAINIANKYTGYKFQKTDPAELPDTIENGGVIRVYYVVKNRPSTPTPPTPPALNKEDHVAYIIGYPDGTVRPNSSITRAEAVTIFFRLLNEESREYYRTSESGFADVSADAWYCNAVSTLSNAGIVTGYKDGSFRPNEPITRAEFAAMAARFSDVAYDGDSSFSDVDSSHWAERFIALAEHLGWVSGYADGSFAPEQQITRAEAITLINRVLEREVSEENMLDTMIIWEDNSPDAWYYEAVQEATNSHEYLRTDERVPDMDYCFEKWTATGLVPDWTALEKNRAESASR